jgi:hypothetical protein
VALLRAQAAKKPLYAQGFARGSEVRNILILAKPALQRTEKRPQVGRAVAGGSMHALHVDRLIRVSDHIAKTGGEHELIC